MFPKRNNNPLTLLTSDEIPFRGNDAPFSCKNIQRI